MAGHKGRGLHSYTVQEAQNAAMGQAGAIFENTTTTVTCITGKVFVAIQFVEDTSFNASSGLVAEDDTLWPNTASGATALSSNGLGGDVVDTPVVFPAGMTIYGRWTSFILTDGAVIAYVG